MTTITDSWREAAGRFSDFHKRLQPTLTYQYSILILKRILPWTILILAAMLYGASIILGLAYH